MIPIVTPTEMAEIDRAAPEPVEVLISRAGSAVAWAARRMLGGTYGRRVVVVAGKGNNGADGRDAAARLAAWGVRVTVIEAADAPEAVPQADLVIDAAYGTGFRGDYLAPNPGPARVLAVDIPSGVDGLTGEAGEGAVRADRTVTFAAYKPGLVLGEGRSRAGRVELSDIGLDVSRARAHLVEAADVAEWWPRRSFDTHKWRSAMWVIAGSPGMTGAATLAVCGGQRAGAGNVRLSVPGAPAGQGAPLESVTTELPATGWAGAVLDGSDRFKALVVGPGLGREAGADVCELVQKSTVPLVIDADGLTALAEAGADASIGPPAVLTPHVGEYERLMGHKPGADRLQAARDLASKAGAVVLLKGSTTVVADPDGQVLVSTAGDERLATAGTGDVLSGMIGALLAGGVEPWRAAAAAAFVHGRAGALGWRVGNVAGDLPDRLPAVLDVLLDDPGAR